MGQLSGVVREVLVLREDQPAAVSECCAGGEQSRGRYTPSDRNAPTGSRGAMSCPSDQDDACWGSSGSQAAECIR